MTTNSQLSTAKPKKANMKTKQTTLTWRVISGEGEGRNKREKAQGIRRIIGRHKIDGERSKMV